jgi:hypothetical protein
MDRWEVPNEPALRLIAGPPLTKTGKRPRFRLIGEQVERFVLLREIDQRGCDLWDGKHVAGPGEFTGVFRPHAPGSHAAQ